MELVEEELSKETEKECISLWKYGKESFKREEVEGQIRIILVKLISIENILLSRHCVEYNL